MNTSPATDQSRPPSRATVGPLVSVLTPFLNEEAYLEECITSILNQGYTNFEYILVDNGSTDASGHIAEEYARSDSRIRVVRNEATVSQMENLNLAAAQVSPEAKYVKYCFGDDWLYPTCVERMVAVLEANPRVGSCCAYTLVETEVFPKGPHPSKAVMSGMDAARHYLLTGEQWFGSPTASMFRADLVREQSPFFNPKRSGDDIEPEMTSFEKWDFAFLNEIQSFTRRAGQTTSTRMNDLNMDAASRLICLKKFGHLFLSAPEYEKTRRAANWEYGRIVARAALTRGIGRVIRAHRAELSTVELTIPAGALGVGMLHLLADTFLNPYLTIRKLIRRRSSRNG